MAALRSIIARAPALLLIVTVIATLVFPASAITADPGATTESGEITGIAFSSNNTVGGIQVVTLFQNTGSTHLTGLLNTVTLHGAGGEVMARAEILCSGETLIPGQEAMCIADLVSGVPAGAVMLETMVQKQDGTILASQEEQLQAGDIAGVDSTPPVSAPGFSACLAGIAMAALGGRVKRRPRIPVSAGETP
ncbi:MAG TPA: hypothetical protein VMB35_07890 [Methanomicrobiales archaeon]|nr:hypothetical protein [Methanomicrobiales archaeon]